MATSDEDSDSTQEPWVEWFCRLKGNEFFCEVDRYFIEDRFNLFGLSHIVDNYKLSMDFILDRGSVDEVEDEAELEASVIQLYGLIHARFILTTQGLNRMHTKYKRGDFGFCPRMLCRGQKVVPMGTHTEVEQDTVKVFCPRCGETYTTCRAVNSSLSPHALRPDGAYFGPTFPHLFFMTFDDEVREAARVQEAYTPRVYGFRVHSSSSSTLAGAMQRIARDDNKEGGFYCRRREESGSAPQSRPRNRSHQQSHYMDSSLGKASASSVASLPHYSTLSHPNLPEQGVEEWGEAEWESFLWGRESAPFLDYPLNVELKLRIAQNLAGRKKDELGPADGLHTTVWEAAIAFYCFALSKHAPSFAGKRVLELGAGTGLVGLTLAALGAEVVLTDLPDAMPLLRHNVQHNLTTVRAMQENTTRGRQTESPGKQMKVQSDASFPVTRVLEWGTASLPSDVETQRKVVETEDEDGAVSPSLPTPCFEIVVGADVMYKLELEDPLLVSIDQCCAWNGRTVLYLARLQRGNPTQYRRFYETLQSKLGFDELEFVLVGGGGTEEGSIAEGDGSADGGPQGGFSCTSKAPSDAELFRRFTALSDQKLPFEIVRACRTRSRPAGFHFRPARGEAEAAGDGDDHGSAAGVAVAS